jgi:hypothetical protein
MDAVLEWGAIELVQEQTPPELGQILHNLVAEPKNGRICSNVRDLNKLATKMKMKMESLRDVRERFIKDTWMISLDMSKHFWAAMIAIAHRKYFRFRLKGRLYQWKVLPFGYINSMQIMDKLMKPVIQKLNTMGIEVLSWVDDLVLMLGANKEEAIAKAQAAIDLLTSLGFVVHPTKTSSQVTKEVKFRAFIWNSETMEVTAPPDKLADIRKQAKSMGLSRMAIRSLATLVGKVRYLSQIHYHLIAWIVESQILIKETVIAKGWEAFVNIPVQVQEEILHWRERSELLSMPIRLLDCLTIETKGDAGPLGYGFEGLYAVAGLWSEMETFYSTNWRELMTWVYQVEEFREHLQGKVSIYATDSTVAVRYIRKIYGKSPVLSRIAAQQAKMMEVEGIIQLPRHVSQEEIKSSDVLSRLREKEDLSVTPQAFERWCRHFQFTPTVDLFASRFSTKLPRFYSRMIDNQSIGTNAFLHPWSQEEVYAFPPQKLIYRTLAKLAISSAPAMVVAQERPMEQWWHSLKRLSQDSLLSRTHEILDVFEKPLVGSRWRIFLIPGILSRPEDTANPLRR